MSAKDGEESEGAAGAGTGAASGVSSPLRAGLGVLWEAARRAKNEVAREVRAVHIEEAVREAAVELKREIARAHIGETVKSAAAELKREVAKATIGETVKSAAAELKRTSEQVSRELGSFLHGLERHGAEYSTAQPVPPAPPAPAVADSAAVVAREAQPVGEPQAEAAPADPQAAAAPAEPQAAAPPAGEAGAPVPRRIRSDEE